MVRKQRTPITKLCCFIERVLESDHVSSKYSERGDQLDAYFSLPIEMDEFLHAGTIMARLLDRPYETQGDRDAFLREFLAPLGKENEDWVLDTFEHRFEYNMEGTIRFRPSFKTTTIEVPTKNPNRRQVIFSTSLVQPFLTEEFARVVLFEHDKQYARHMKYKMELILEMQQSSSSDLTKVMIVKDKTFRK